MKVRLVTLIISTYITNISSTISYGILFKLCNDMCQIDGHVLA